MNDRSPVTYPVGYAFQDLIGFRKVAFETDYARFELDLGPHLNNRAGVPHGGVYSLLLDTALGSAGCYIGKRDDFRLAVTLNLNVSFISAPRGKLLIAEGKRIGGGSRIYFSEGTVTDELGSLVASGAGTFRYLSEA